MKNTLRCNKGFSLIELLIVVVVIGILSAIAIPNLLSSRRNANEGSAISDLRLLHGAQMTYASSFGQGNYAGNFTSALNGEALAQLNAAGIIDVLLGGAFKSGYIFTGAKVDGSSTIPPSFCLRAVPVVGSGTFATGPHNIAIATEGVLYSGDANVVTTAGCSIVSGSETVTSAVPL